MRKIQRNAIKSLVDCYMSFEERAVGNVREPGGGERGDASSGFCFAALVAAAGFMISATANAAPF